MDTLLRIHRALALGLLLAAAASGSIARDYPSRPLQMVVPFAPGGGLDLNARNFAEAMSESLGQSIVVINRDGATGIIGLTSVSKAPSDGYTLAFTPAVPLSSEPHRLKTPAYNLDSFRYVCQVFDNIFAIAVPAGSPYRGISDILADARKAPGRVAYGTTGTGSIPHLGTSDIENAAQVSLTHVPYKGDAPMLRDLLSDRLNFGAVLVSSISAHLESGALRLIAVYSDRRHPSFPAIPTLKEAGVPVTQVSFGGILVPARTSDAIVERLESSCRDAVASPKYQDYARRANQVVDFRPAKDFESNMREDSRLKAATIQRLGLQNP